MKKISLFTLIILGFTVSIFAQIPNYVPTSGLLAWYPFNGNANDESGNGHHGTVNGALLSLDRNGLANGAYSFSSNNIVVPYDALLNPKFPFSISFWGKTNSPTGAQTWVSTNPLGESEGWDLMPYQNDGMNYELAINNEMYSFTSEYIYPQSEWVHNVFVFTETSISVYINGELVETNNYPSWAITYNNNPLVFGSTTTGDNWLNGSLDEIGLWNRVLSDCEIQELYKSNIKSTVQKKCTGKNIILTATEGVDYLWNTGETTASITVSPTISTKYFVEVTDEFGCKSIEFDSVFVHSTTKPLISILSQNNYKFNNVALGGIATSNSHWGGNLPENAFDGDSIYSGWGSDGDLPAKSVWIAYEFGIANPQVVNAYSIYCSSKTSGGWGLAGYDPYQWTFEGFDGQNWIVLDSRIDLNQQQDIWKHFYFANTTAYQEYRLYSKNGGTSSYIMITELKMGYVDLAKCKGNELNLTTKGINNLKWSTNEVKDTILVKPNTNTTYSVSGLDSNGCDASNSINIIVKQPTSLILNETVTNSYTLNDVTYNSTGIYNQTLTNIAGCDSVITLNLTVSPLTGIDNLNESTEIKIYPNPFQNEINLTVNANDLGVLFQILDLQGKVLMNGKLDSQNVKVNLTNLKSGIYLFKLLDEKNTILKIVKE